MTNLIHNRHSVRLPHYDYGQVGAYFVTINVKERECLLGELVGEEIRLSGNGEIVSAVWNELPEHYANVELGEFVIMPNHVHGIVWITGETINKNVGAQKKMSTKNEVGAGFKPALTKSVKQHGLPEIVRGFKSFSARKINQFRNTPDTPFWQRSYHEHIIRNNDDLQTHRNYIQNNPLKWTLDEYYREME